MTTSATPYMDIEKLLHELRLELPMQRLEDLDRGFSLFTIVAAARALQRFCAGDFGRWLCDAGIPTRGIALVDFLLGGFENELESLSKRLRVLRDRKALTPLNVQLELEEIYQALDGASFDGRDLLDACA